MVITDKSMIGFGSPVEPTRVAFVIPSQYWSGSISLTVDVLSGINLLIQQEAIGDAACYDIHFLYDPSVEPQGMSDCTFTMKALDDHQYDIVIIPAIWSITPKEIKAYSRLFEWLKKQREFDAHFVSITNGAFFLAEAGILSGREVSIHWAFQDLFQSLYPDVRVRSDLPCCYTGSVWSSSGISPTMDLVYQLIRKYSGETLAQSCAKYFMLEDHIKPPKDITLTSKRDTLVSAIKDWLHINYHREISSKDIADQFHMSYRNLNRRFTEEMGKPPQEYLQGLRLDRAAKLMASTNMSVEHVALQCGYGSANSLGKIFKKKFGRSPLAYRKYMLTRNT
jgi:transcriptional regulator GlxA family with amidase domain